MLHLGASLRCKSSSERKAHVLRAEDVAHVIENLIVPGYLIGDAGYSDFFIFFPRLRSMSGTKKREVEQEDEEA